MTISKEDYYTNMYDIENLTPLSERVYRTVGRTVRNIEALIRGARNRDAHTVLRRAAVDGTLENTLELVMLRGALWAKNLIFRSSPCVPNDSAPAWSAETEILAYLDQKRRDKQRRDTYASFESGVALDPADYVYETRETVRKRMRVEEPVREDWLRRKPDPTSHESVTQFYRETDSYIFELMAANNVAQTLYSYSVLMDKLKPLSISKVLDYGGGVGSLSILLDACGYDVTYADLPGSTSDFARWRFKTRNRSNRDLPVVMIAPDTYTASDLECIVCTEVVEHVVDPVSLLKRFHDWLAPKGVLVVSESCEYVEQFASHLPSNRRYGGENFVQLLSDIGFTPIMTEPYIPQQIFVKKDV